ncbi:MAG: TatD family hydrolase [Phycisphaeraceae bacterium]
MIDTHCHLTFPDLASRVDEVLAAARDAGVDRMITVGTTPDDARRAATLAQQHDSVYATVGLHPHYVAQMSGRDALRAAMHELAAQPRVVALGEMGLDYHYDDPPRAAQQQAFRWQLEIAAELADLPIIIHNRKATDDTLAMIREEGLPGERFVFHCFTGDAREVEQILGIGAMVSFTGIVTFKNAGDIAEASDRVPMERLMVETDSPYLTPAPHRKVRPNEPRYVVDVARFLAKRRGMSMEAFVAQVDANAQRFFNL